ncbi:hypothetical protein KJ782_01975, partial [Patescibacteria group bacterium]|nr:hypothetical protein [Patescibacteria group bacterium]
ILWNFKVKDGIMKTATALADGTILFVAGTTLYRINEEGKYLFKLTLDNPLVTSPIIDQNGQIHVASSEMLYAII